MPVKNELVILAGGRGLRIKEFNKNLPKPMFKINKKYFLDYLVQNYCKFNFKNIHIIAGYKGKKIYQRFNNKIINFVKIKCVVEKKPRDTYGALYILKKKLKNNFFLANGDTFFDINFNEFAKNKLSNQLINVALVKNKSYRTNNKLNNLTIGKDNYLKSNNKSKLMNAGFYFIKKELIKKIKNKKISLENEIIPTLIKQKKIKGFFSDRFFIDIGTPKNLIKSKKLIPNHFYKPAAFFDRDGVINHDFGYTHKIENFKFKRGVLKALRFLSKKNYYIFIVTNQAGIAKGKFKEKDFINLHSKLKTLLSDKKIYIDQVEYCPHHPKAKIKKFRKKCSCRKPGNLMIRKIMKNWHINVKKSFMIGDQIKDKLAAEKSGIKFQFVQEDLFKQVNQII